MGLGVGVGLGLGSGVGVAVGSGVGVAVGSGVGVAVGSGVGVAVGSGVGVTVGSGADVGRGDGMVLTAGCGVTEGSGRGFTGCSKLPSVFCPEESGVSDRPAILPSAASSLSKPARSSLTSGIKYSGRFSIWTGSPSLTNTGSLSCSPPLSPLTDRCMTASSPA